VSLDRTPPASTPRSPTVALFVTCLANVYRPSVAEAAVELLERAGCRVEVPPNQSCCGQIGYNAGAIDSARPVARNLISVFEGFDYVVAPSGSCAGMIAHHYPLLFGDDPLWAPRASALAAKTWEITSFLVDVMRFSAPLTIDLGQRVASYHDSCAGFRELGIRQQPRKLLADAGAGVTEMQGTEVCCGFGGTFCAKLPDISVAMADEKIRNARAAGANTIIGGDLGCLLHLAGRSKAAGHGMEFRHVLEVLTDRLKRPALGEEQN